ncbi:hypothetical protein [Methylobacterium sp. JK268]
MTASIVSLATRRPVDPVVITAYARFESQRQAAHARRADEAAAHRATMAAVAQAIGETYRIIAAADPDLARAVRGPLLRAASLVLPEIDAAARAAGGVA